MNIADRMPAALRTLILSALLGALSLLLIPSLATASTAGPVTYGFTSGYISGIEASINTDLIFDFDETSFTQLNGTPFPQPASGSAYQVLLDDSSNVVLDFDAGTSGYGQINSLDLSLPDFKVVLDSSLTNLNYLNVYDMTISSTGPTDMNAPFTPEVVSTHVTAEVDGQLANSNPVTKTPFESIGTSPAQITILHAQDQIQIVMFGIALASFPQLEVAAGLNAPPIDVRANITFFGSVVATPIPEPSAALLYAAGFYVVTFSRSRRRGQA